MPKTITEPTDYILSSEAARIAHVSVQSTRLWERTGRLRAFAKTASGLRVFSRAEVERAAKEHEQRHSGSQNGKRKGTRAEHRAVRILAAAGYACTRASASLGLFDAIGIGPNDVRLVQVKAGTKYLSAIEREQIQALSVLANVSRECWRFPDRCRAPIIRAALRTALWNHMEGRA